jgi:hypothetical protein
MKVQITAAMFDDPHPNNAHIPGVEYSPKYRCVFVPTKTGLSAADIGDWIVRVEDGSLAVVRNDDGNDAA